MSNKYYIGVIEEKYGEFKVKQPLLFSLPESFKMHRAGKVTEISEACFNELNEKGAL